MGEFQKLGLKTKDSNLVLCKNRNQLVVQLPQMQKSRTLMLISLELEGPLRTKETKNLISRALFLRTGIKPSIATSLLHPSQLQILKNKISGLVLQKQKSPQLHQLSTRKRCLTASNQTNQACNKTLPKRLKIRKNLQHRKLHLPATKLIFQEYP